MGYVHFLSHFVVLAVVWLVLACLIGFWLANEDVVDTDKAAEAGMIVSTIICAFVLGIIYW